MILEKLSIINYKNIASAALELSPKINCLIGQNGVGKTNVLDAIYFLSFCHSANNPNDSQVIRHGENFFMLEGRYLESEENGERSETIAAAMNGTHRAHPHRGGGTLGHAADRRRQRGAQKTHGSGHLAV